MAFVGGNETEHATTHPVIWHKQTNIAKIKISAGIENKQANIAKIKISAGIENKQKNIAKSRLAQETLLNQD